MFSMSAAVIGMVSRPRQQVDDLVALLGRQMLLDRRQVVIGLRRVFSRLRGRAVPVAVHHLKNLVHSRRAADVLEFERRAASAHSTCRAPSWRASAPQALRLGHRATAGEKVDLVDQLRVFLLRRFAGFNDALRFFMHFLLSLFHRLVAFFSDFRVQGVERAPTAHQCTLGERILGLLVFVRQLLERRQR